MPGGPNDNLTPQKLEIGYWVATHKPQLRKAGTIALAVITSISVLVFLVQLIIFLAGIPQARQVEQALLTDPVNYGARTRPASIIVQSAESVIRDETTIDIVASLENPNTGWAALEFEYDIIVGGSSAGRDTVVIAPGQTVYVTRMSVPFSAEEAPAVQVEVLNTQWINYPEAKLPNESWTTSGEVFRSIRNEDEENASFQSEMRFLLHNRSVYGFVAPEIIVLLRNQDGDLVAIGSATPNTIESLEERLLTFRWPQRLGTALETEVHVTVDKVTEESIITD